MCQFANSNPGAFAFLQSTTYLFGEAFPIMLIFLLQMLEIRSIKQKRSSKNKGMSEQSMLLEPSGIGASDDNNTSS